MAATSLAVLAYHRVASVRWRVHGTMGALPDKDLKNAASAVRRIKSEQLPSAVA